MSRAKTLTLAFALSMASVLGGVANAARGQASPDLAEGVKMTQAQCAAITQAVFVEIEGQGTCLRYFLSTAGGQGKEALVYLSGDAPTTVHIGDKGLSLSMEEGYTPPSFDQLQRFADQMSQSARGPALFLSRMGLDGSSGWHAHRRTLFEVKVTNAALEAIKVRHGFEKYHLAGQSGGGHLVGALLSQRTDIGCAVPGAGVLVFDDRPIPADRMPASMARFFDPSGQALAVSRLKNTRILVVTDPADRRVPIEKQIGFVRRVNALGGKARQFFVRALDDEQHQLRTYSLSAAYACIQGLSDEEIEVGLLKLSSRMLDQKVTAAKPKPGTQGSASGVPGATTK